VKSDDFTSVESLAGCKKSNLSQKNKWKMVLWDSDQQFGLCHFTII
jgi:hypothetical protein